MSKDRASPLGRSGPRAQRSAGFARRRCERFAVRRRERGALSALDHELEVVEVEASGEEPEQDARAAATVELADHADLVAERPVEHADAAALLDDARPPRRALGDAGPGLRLAAGDPA